mgnify:CR=1
MGVPVAVFVFLEDLDAETVDDFGFGYLIDGVPEVGEGEAVGAFVERFREAI